MNKNDEQKLYAYLDGELSPKETREFSEHINQDPALKKSFEFSKNLSGQIKASLKQELLRQNPQAEEVDLWASIRDDILQHKESKQLTSSAIFLERLREIFTPPQFSFPRMFSPAFIATSFALVFAFYFGQKAEQYISRDVATLSTEDQTQSAENKQNLSPSSSDEEVLNMSELSFVGNQVGARSASASASRIFRSRLQQASSLPPRNLESAMPSCFIKLNSPLLGVSPKEPIELGIEKQVTFTGVDGTPQRLRLKLLRFIPRSGLPDILDMQVRWLDQTNESLVAENLRVANGSRIFLEAGKKPEEQTKVVLAAQCELR